MKKIIQVLIAICLAKDKKLFWIEGTDQRFQGYNYFGQNPKVMLEWFDKHFK